MKGGGNIQQLKALTAKHKKFVQKCFELRSRSEAYKSVYKVKDNHTAAVNAHRLMQDPLIQAYYNEIQTALDDEGIATVSEVMQKLTDIVRGKASDYSITAKGEAVKRPPKLSDVIRAGEIIMKRRDTAKQTKDAETTYGVLLMPEAAEPEEKE